MSDLFGSAPLETEFISPDRTADVWVDSVTKEPLWLSGSLVWRSAHRSRFFLVILLVVWAIFFLRAADLMIRQGSSFLEIANRNRTRTVRSLPQRGILLDRFGTPLAQNRLVFQARLLLSALPQNSLEREKTFEELSRPLGLQQTDLALAWVEAVRNQASEILVARDLPYEQAMRIYLDESRYPAIRLVQGSSRQYPASGVSLSHVLGYVADISEDEWKNRVADGYVRSDEIGRTGLEAVLEPILRGRPGFEAYETDARGRRTSMRSKEDPEPGEDVRLTIDAPFQMVIEQRLSALLSRLNLHRASVIAMNPQNGQVLAIVSLPAYDNNAFARGISPEAYAELSEDPNQPLFFRAVSGLYPSGSTFKPFVASAALAERLITPSTSFLSVGGLRVGQWFFPDWKAGGHGVTDVYKAIAESVNTFFYTIGGGYDKFSGLGLERIVSYARLFGFGAKTGIEVSGEADGFLPSAEWKLMEKGEPWYIGDTYHLAIGQGDLLVTPIQMAVATAAIANGKTWTAPTLVWSIGDRLPTAESRELPKDLSEATTVIRDAMRRTVTDGSARRLSILPIAIAGKTGTAQSGAGQAAHAWFTSFAPSDDPQIVLTILVEEGGEGSSVAVPLAEEIYSWWTKNRLLPEMDSP